MTKATSQSLQLTNQKLDTADRFLNIISDPKKAISIIILIAAGIALIWLVWRLVKNSLSTAATAVSSTAALASEIASGGTLSYTSSEYSSYATRLYTAMKGLGTDESAIYNIFYLMKTKADVLKLIAVFGTKDEMTLSEWLADDLSTSEILKVNTILSDSGIDYQF